MQMPVCLDEYTMSLVKLLFWKMLCWYGVDI